MNDWDPVAEEHLGVAVETMTAVGLTDLVRRAATDVWRANCARFDPEHLYDDARTLGFTAASNLANRVHDELGPRRSLRGVAALQEYTAAVVLWDDWRLRLVKVPAAQARRPRLRSGFDWTQRPARREAAAHNANAYRAPWRMVGAEPLFDLPRPDAAEKVKGCRELFLLWGGEIRTQLTAGWVGLPTTDQDRWLAVAPLWWDDPPTGRGVTIPEPVDAPLVAFGEDMPKPMVRLKRKSADVQS